MEKIDLIKKETEELIAKIVDSFEIEVKEEDEIYYINIKSEKEASVIIGRHGETIRSIQKLLEVVLYKKLNQSIEILVNVNDFREKQKEKLEILADEYADKVRDNQQSITIKNLSSYERKIIHEYITKNHPDLKSYSIGEGKDRKLVIELK